MQIVRFALAGVGLAALLAGCAGEPEPVSEPRVAERPAGRAAAAPAPQVPRELPIKKGAKAFAPLPAGPEEVDLNSVPGDGKPFPLEVSLVERPGGKPLPYWLGDERYIFTTHPKAEDRNDWTAPIPAQTEARVRWERFMPALYDFRPIGRNVPRIVVSTGIWTQPPGGKLEIPLHSFELRGTVLDAQGRGYSGSRLTFKGQGLEVDRAVAPWVRFITAYFEIDADAQGAFRVPYMMRGTWMVSYRTGRQREDGGWNFRNIRTVIKVEDDSPLTLQWVDWGAK